MPADWRRALLYALLGAAFAWGGCHTARKAARSTRAAPSAPVTSPAPVDTAAAAATAATETATVLEKIRARSIDYTSFSARAKLDYNTPRGSQNGINAFVRIRRDSALWISIRPVLGIEYIRVLVTPDSVKVINFFKKTLTVRSADSLGQLLSVPFNFGTLEDLLVGNPALLGDSAEAAGSGGTQSVSFSQTAQGMKSVSVFSVPDYRLTENDLTAEDTTAGPRASREAFSDYHSVDGRDFSNRRSVLLHTGSEATAEIRFSKVVFDGPVSFPFPEAADFRRN